MVYDSHHLSHFESGWCCWKNTHISESNRDACRIHISVLCCDSYSCGVRSSYWVSQKIHQRFGDHNKSTLGVFVRSGSSMTTCTLRQVLEASPYIPAVCSLPLHYHIHLPSEPHDTVPYCDESVIRWHSFGLSFSCLISLLLIFFCSQICFPSLNSTLNTLLPWPLLLMMRHYLQLYYSWTLLPRRRRRSPRRHL